MNTEMNNRDQHSLSPLRALSYAEVRAKFSDFFASRLISNTETTLCPGYSLSLENLLISLRYFGSHDGTKIVMDRKFKSTQVASATRNNLLSVSTVYQHRKTGSDALRKLIHAQTVVFSAINAALSTDARTLTFAFSWFRQYAETGIAFGEYQLHSPIVGCWSRAARLDRNTLAIRDAIAHLFSSEPIVNHLAHLLAMPGSTAAGWKWAFASAWLADDTASVRQQHLLVGRDYPPTRNAANGARPRAWHRNGRATCARHHAAVRNYKRTATGTCALNNAGCSSSTYKSWLSSASWHRQTEKLTAVVREMI